MKYFDFRLSDVATSNGVTYIIDASSIHPSVLDSLIPVDMPSFFCIDGVKTVITRSLQQYSDPVFTSMDGKNLPLIQHIIKQIKSFGSKYLYQIIVIDQKEKPPNKYYIMARSA